MAVADPPEMPELDAQMQAFVERVEAFAARPEDGEGVAARRAVFNRMCAAFARPWPRGVWAEDRDLGGVACRVFHPAPGPAARATVLYLHGGGFVVGGLDSHADICADLAAATTARVVALDYRLAPAHLHPAAHDDTLAAAHAAIEAFDGPLILAGDSAGACLAASAAVQARQTGLALDGLVLVNPMLGGVGCDPALHPDYPQAPLLSLASVGRVVAARFAPDAVDRHDPTAWPLQAAELSGLPPCAIFVAEFDPLAPDGRHFAARLRASGVPVGLVEEAGMVHGYLRARHMATAAGEGFDRIVGALTALIENDRSWFE